jgi:predicted MFS family arabinose efflux permease
MPDHHLHNARLTSILSGIFLACIFGTRPLVPLLANQIGASNLEVGFIVSVFAVLPALVIVPMGRMIGRWSPRAKLFLTVFISSAGLLMVRLFPNMAGLCASQLIAGLTYAIFLVAALEFTGHCSTPSTRDGNVMRLSIGNAIGSFVGPAAGGALSDAFGYEQTFLILGATGMAASFITVFLIGANGKPETEAKSSGTSFKLLALPNFRRAIVISVLVLLAKDMYTAYFPLLGKQFGYSSTIIGLAVSVNALAGIFIRLLLPKLNGTFGKSAVLTGSFASAALFFILIPLLPQVSAQLAISLLLGLGLGIGQPMSMSETLAALPKERLSDGLGLRISFNRASQVASPVLFGAFSQLLGLASIFWGVGIIVLAGCFAVRNRAGGSGTASHP